MAYGLFDGTLADSAAWLFDALPDVANRYGFRSVDARELAELRGKNTRVVLGQLGVSWWKLPFIARHLRARMAAERDRIRTFSGVHDLLAELERRGVVIAVVSSNAEDNVRSVLGSESAARVRYYECGVGLFGKRARFQRLLRQSGIAPEAAIAIGDEPREIEAAASIGIASGAVGWGYATPELLRAHRPTVYFDSIEAMTDHLLGSVPTV